jgi:two-component system response regulator FlrC
MKATILVVDDDAILRRPLQRALEAGGYDVVAVASGEEALAALAATPVDLLVTDRGLPGVDGWELIRRVGVHRPDLPVVLITGSPEAAPANLRVQATLRKPFGPEELLDVVARALAGRRGAATKAPPWWRGRAEPTART